MKPWEQYGSEKAPKPWEQYAPAPQEEAVVEAPAPEQGLHKTLYNMFDQGLTMGFGDDLGDLYRSGARAIRGDNFKDAFAEEQDFSHREMEAQREQHPVASTVAEMTGALSTGVTGAATKTGSKIARWLSSGKLPTRMAKGAAVSAPSGFTYGAGSAEGDLDERLKAGGEMALTSAVLAPTVIGGGAAVKHVAGGTKNLYKGFRARDVEALEQAANTIKDRSKQAYSYFRESGAKFKPQVSQKIIKQLESDLVSDGKLNPRLHDKVVGLMSDMKKEMKKTDLTLEGLDQWRQLFGEVAGNYTDKVNARKASLLMRSIDDAMGNINHKDLMEGTQEAIDALNLGRSEWARQSKFNQITDIVRKSDGDANYLKRELKKFVNNPKKTRGFTKEEMETLNEAATTSFGEGIMKMLGKFGIDLGNSRIGNTALPVLGGAAATTAGGGIVGGAAVPAIGTGARYGQKLLARGKAEKLLKTIEGVGDNAPKSLPDVLKTRELSNKYGQSELGALMAGNKDIPISKLKDVPPDVMKKIMAMSPAEARKALNALTRK